jgi:hypothetical protein
MPKTLPKLGSIGLLFIIEQPCGVRKIGFVDDVVTEECPE